MRVPCRERIGYCECQQEVHQGITCLTLSTKRPIYLLKDNTSDTQMGHLIFRDPFQHATGTINAILHVAHSYLAIQAAAHIAMIEVLLGQPLLWENLDTYQLTGLTTQPGAEVLDLHAHLSNSGLGIKLCLS